MKIRFTGGTIEECGTVLSVPHGSSVDVQFESTEILRCKKAFEERDPVSMASSLGLPDDTPAELIIEAITALRASNEPAESVLKESRIWTFIGRSVDSATAIQMLATLATSAIGLPLM